MPEPGDMNERLRGDLCFSARASLVPVLKKVSDSLSVHNEECAAFSF